MHCFLLHLRSAQGRETAYADLVMMSPACSVCCECQLPAASELQNLGAEDVLHAAAAADG